MENKSKRVFLLTLFCFLIYFITSIIFQVFSLSWEPFDRVNLISDIFPKKTEAKKGTLIIKSSTNRANIQNNQQQDIELYKTANLITNFYKSDSAVLPQFLEKLQKLKNGQKIKIRIAYFGDSMIEGDLLTQTLRKLLQSEYGGSGVGFVPISSNVAGFRQTVTSSASGWDDTSFKTKGAKNLYFSGHIFTGNGSGSYTDRTVIDPNAMIEKSLIFGKVENEKIEANGKTFNLAGPETVNRQPLFNDHSLQLKISSASISAPLYGVSFESDNGIFVDKIGRAHV